MEKKKPSEEKTLLNSLCEEFNKMNPNDLDSLLTFFNVQLEQMAKLPHITYSYQHPDYEKKAHPIAEHLQSFELLGWDFDLSETFIRDLLSTPDTQLADELENLIINDLASFHQQAEGETLPMQSNFILALLLLKEIRSSKSIDIVLEVLRQDTPFFNAYFGDTGSEVFPPIICQLASDQLPKLLDFMKEPGILPFGKTFVAMAVANIACTTPVRRLEVISWFCQALNFFYDHVHDEAIFDGIIIDSMAFEILNIHAKETLPILDKLYATDLIMPFMAPDIKIIHKKINKGDTVELDNFDIYQSLEEFDAIYSEIEEEEEEEEEDFTDVIANFYNFMKENGIKKSSKEPLSSKCLTLQISLQDIEPKVWRMVEVPSSLTLPELHDVIQTVMGWEDYHFHQFSKGRTRYMSSEQAEEQLPYSSTSCIDYTDVTIGELLMRKRSKICYEYDFGDGWNHDIVLEEQRPYRKDEQPRIYLLDGANACPPEDCGGCWGFMELKEAMKHKRSKAYKEFIDWLGEPFDPTAFDKEEINELLEGMN